MTQQDLDRRELIRHAIVYVAGKNDNMPGQARRVLSQKFGVEVLEIEIEAECQVVAGEAVLRIAQLARKVAR